MSYFADRPLPPVTALDDLYDEARSCDRSEQGIPLYDERPRRLRRCRECGGWNGSHHVMCPNGE